MYRSPEQAQAIRDAGATPVDGDLIADSAERLQERLAGHDAVVFSAGAHGTGKDMLDEPGTGRVEAGLAITYGSVPRDDVAGFIAAALFEPRLNRVAVELTSGDVPIRDAVAALVPRPWRPSPVAPPQGRQSVVA